MSAVGHNYDSIGTAEDCLLGALLIGVDAWANLAELRSLDFKPETLSAPHRTQLLKEIEALAEEMRRKDGDQALNTLAICEWTHSRGTADACGGLSYISQLADNAASYRNIGHLAGRIAKHAGRRRLAGMARELEAAARDAEREVDAIAVDFSRQLAELPLAAEPAREETAADLISSVLWAANNPQQDECWSTGIAELDAMLAPADSSAPGGLVPGRLYLVAGRPKHGKSTLGLNIACNAAAGGLRVHIDSLEMSSTREAAQGHDQRRPGDLAYKIAQLGSRVPYGALAGSMRPDQYEKLHRASFDISEWRLTVDASPSRHFSAIFAAARRRKARYADFSVLVIDYAGLIKGDRGADRRITMGEVSRGCKALAKELGIAVILIAQLNRGCEDRADKRPRAADLKESGDLEQDADAILLVQQPGLYEQWEGSKAFWLRLDIYRHGQPAEVCLTFNGATQRITGPTVLDPVKGDTSGGRRGSSWRSK